ncbi:response regulator [Thalassobius vesicularis]|uniref:histidine kinase n=1 Tax=Thalassobius vesicularis TaxID=1294297 RepID=A0A4S3MD41_9RHOB|nr:ATP-binding protein [Thalassobius vesicularis]THD74951.1 response regulator [Thalassobius vesicularis]
MSLTQSVTTSPRHTPQWLSVAMMVSLGVASIVSGALVDAGVLGLLLIAAGMGLLTASVVVFLAQAMNKRRQRMLRRTASTFLANDPALCFVTDDLGQIQFANEPAQARLHPDDGATMAAALRDILANPGTSLARLQIRAEAVGGAMEEVVTRRGLVRLVVTALGRESFAWRVEELPEARTRPTTATQVPMLTVGRSGAILSMNDAARSFVGSRARSLDDVFPDGPINSGSMTRVNRGEVTHPCFVSETARTGGKRDIFFLPAGSEEEGKDTDWAVFDNLPVALLRIGCEGEIVQSNRLARDLLGLTTTQGVQLPKIVEGLGRPVSDWLADARQGRGLNKSEFLRLKSAKAEVFLQITLSRYEEGASASIVAVLHDATELKNLEAQFVQSQKMQAIGELAGGVAHDFNNLLTAISGHCDLLMLRHDQADSDFPDLVQIAQNANRAAALVGQLLAFSRKQTLRPEVLDLRETLSDLTHLLNRLVGEKVSLNLRHDPMLKSIRADKRQLEQVLMNLVVNARDAMPNGGEIRIDTGVQNLENALERDRAIVPPGEYVTVRVVDQGVGIEQDLLQKIFEPFYTTKRVGEGTGLGLSTAYGIVKQSGGYIFVDSDLGVGTVFTLMFPAYMSATDHEGLEMQPSPDIQTTSFVNEQGIVLLVEDEAPVRAFASRALKMRGYTVIEAGTGEEAIELLKDPQMEVDLFVTDVIMPGMDGPTWVREARKARPNTRVVFVSGYAEDALDDSADPVEGSIFLPKPFSLNDLLSTVNKQLALL